MPQLVARSMAAVLLAAAVLPFARAAAQSSSARPLQLRMAAVRAWSGNDLLGSLPGVDATLHVPTSERVGLVLGAEWLQATRDETGVPCAGLIQPGTCAPERVARQGRLFTLGVGVVGSVVRRPHAALDFMLGLRAGDARTSTRGRTSGRSISGGEAVLGAEAGVDVSVVPRLDWPVALYVGARGGALGTPSSSRVYDGYTPFEKGFGLARVQAGVSWTLPRVR